MQLTLQNYQSQLDVDSVSSWLKKTPAVHIASNLNMVNFQTKPVMQLKRCSWGAVAGDLRRGRWLGFGRRGAPEHCRRPP